ncbi:MAG: TylF/MycF/NovP-related O-methyltransferase [Pseudomonadota bacterium]
MQLFKARNKYRQAEQTAALQHFKQNASSLFIGDEMLVVNKNMHFMQDKKFNALMDELATAEIYQGMAWRMHVLIWACQQALNVPGDFMECGVFRGFKSYFLLRYFADEMSARTYYLCDTFEGIDEAKSDGSPIQKSEHDKVNLNAFVQHRFAEFGHAKIIKGSVPESFKDESIEQLAFLHLDMNSYIAELGALERLWDNISHGGVLILDDFGLLSHSAQMHHELPWLNAKNHRVLEFPTGQGIVIKSEHAL